MTSLPSVLRTYAICAEVSPRGTLRSLVAALTGGAGHGKATTITATMATELNAAKNLHRNPSSPLREHLDMRGMPM